MMRDTPLNLSLLPIFISLAGLCAAVFLGSAIGNGYGLELYVTMIGVFGLVIVLSMGRKYWLLIPFSLSFTAPVIPLGARAVELPELAIIACAILCLAWIALKSQKLTLFRPAHTPFLLYAAWAALIYMHNPIGLSGFGASSGGGRFYLKIFLGLAAFLIAVNQDITERDCKWIFIMTGVGAAFDFAKMVFYYRVLGFSIGGFENSLNFYTWQQELSGVPLILVLIFFSRYRASEIFSWKNPWGPMLLLVCVPLIFLSGKRSAVICLFLYPAIATFYRREFRYLFLSGGCALAVAVVLVAGHGTLFHLPLTTQRALSWLPGKWDSELTNMEGGTDAFRAKLRTFARTRISQHPWIGRGYDVQAESSARLSLTMENKFDAYVEQQALGSSWHNRWLGYAADFGIPASILLAFIYLSIIVLCWRTVPRLPSGSLLQTMVMFTLIMTVTDVLFSNVSGHSALDAFTRWWMYGVVVSIASSLRPQSSSPQLDSPRFRRAPVEPDSQPVHLPG